MAEEFQAGICSPMSWWNSPFLNEQSLYSTQPSSQVGMHDQIHANFGEQRNEIHDLLPGLFESIDPLNNDILNDSVQILGDSCSNHFSRNHLNKFQAESDCSSVNSMKRSREIKKNKNEHTVLKKPRISTPSPLPTFKVRKEKLGDRVTALQQLVSPFGKTDTASVLHEAIDYIKFLHGQVGALSTPYLKNGHEMQYEKLEISNKKGLNQDLKSRGLCLVPISSTFAIASESPIDLWGTNILGSYI